MTWGGLAWTWLWARPLSTWLSLALMALGLASITFVLAAGDQVERRFQRDLQGIHLVVGAKGSPIQLILSSVFHIDVPTGNVPVAAMTLLAEHPLVERVIPVSLGDSYLGHRIVGTSTDYLAHYGARLAQGRVWAAPMEAVLGADVARRAGLGVGDRFVGVHGLGGGGHAHGDAPYTVVGVLAPAASVLDGLVLTDTESVWHVHEQDMATDEEDLRLLRAEREVTALLVRYRTPMAAATLPRWVNAQGDLQAAAPAVEVTRLLRLLGVGAEMLRGFGALLLLTAGLSVFVALYHAVGERRHDLAMLRLLGARPADLAALLMTQALWLALLGVVLGLALGQGLLALLAHLLAQQRSLALSPWAWPATLWLVPALAVGVAALAAALPARGAYRLDVGALMQAPR